jgi:hypothetical protein
VSDQNPASTGQESFGSVPAGRESLGSVPSGSESFGATPPPVPPAAPAAPATPPPVPAQAVPVAATTPGMPDLPPPPRPPAAEPPKKKRGAMRWILTGFIVIVVALIALVVAARFLNKPTPLAMGDCIDQTQFTTSVSDVKAKKTAVDCTSPSASHKVIGVVADKPSSELNDENVCKAFPQTVATIWLNDQGNPGTIYCLAELSK